MSKLRDRVVSSDRCLLDGPMYESFFTCPVIDFSNVTAYFEQHYAESCAYESLSKSFNQAPPFPCFWMESKARSIHPELSTYGIFVRTIDFEQAKDEMKAIPFGVQPKWLLLGDIFDEMVATKPYGPLIRTMLPIVETGETAIANGEPVFWATDLTTGEPAEGDMIHVAMDMLAPLSLALTFMHCKGVSLVDNIPPAPLQKKHLKKRRNAQPLVTYKTILIQSAMRVLKDEGHIDQHGMAKALHICRGHFKHFAEDRPLFGKLSGTFWWPSHIRGSENAGVAIRDYRVSPPKHDGQK